MSRTYIDGRVHVRATMCSTCIFRPGNLMHLEEGRVEGMVAGAGDDGCIPCHSHLYEGQRIEPVCRGFYERHANRVLRMAEAFDVIEFTDGEPVTTQEEAHEARPVPRSRAAAPASPA